MSNILVNCFYCNKSFYKEKKRVNEALKFRWNNFCSSICKNASKSIKLLLTCKNANCQKQFQRIAGHIKNINTSFCSHSCAAIVNNKKFPKRKIPDKTCPACKKVFHSYINTKYCSLRCLHDSRLIDKEIIINKIKLFYDIHKHIPFKNEFPMANSARKRFGSWNKAIQAAGYIPNKVKFTKKLMLQMDMCVILFLR